MNNLYKQYGNSNILKQFNDFKSRFTGDPKETVMQMLKNGQITQADLNRAQAMANQLKGILDI